MEYASFGDTVFLIPHYKRHSEDNKYEWIDINTIYAPSSKQFFQTENRKVEVEVLWHIDFCDPMMELEALKVIASEGQPQTLIIGGNVIGNFVIKGIYSETQKVDYKGNPIMIKARVEFSEFPYKQLKTKKIKPKAVKNKKKINPNLIKADMNTLLDKAMKEGKG